jgi:hypothetical protein
LNLTSLPKLGFKIGKNKGNRKEKQKTKEKKRKRDALDNELPLGGPRDEVGA